MLCSQAGKPDLLSGRRNTRTALPTSLRSREQWRIRAERAGEPITTLEVEIASTDYGFVGGDNRRQRSDLHQGVDHAP